MKRLRLRLRTDATGEAHGSPQTQPHHARDPGLDRHGAFCQGATGNRCHDAAGCDDGRRPWRQGQAAAHLVPRRKPALHRLFQYAAQRRRRRVVENGALLVRPARIFPGRSQPAGGHPEAGTLLSRRRACPVHRRSRGAAIRHRALYGLARRDDGLRRAHVLRRGCPRPPGKAAGKRGPELYFPGLCPRFLLSPLAATHALMVHRRLCAIFLDHPLRRRPGDRRHGAGSAGQAVATPGRRLSLQPRLCRRAGRQRQRRPQRGRTSRIEERIRSPVVGADPLDPVQPRQPGQVPGLSGRDRGGGRPRQGLQARLRPDARPAQPHALALPAQAGSAEDDLQKPARGGYRLHRPAGVRRPTAAGPGGAEKRPRRQIRPYLAGAGAHRGDEVPRQRTGATDPGAGRDPVWRPQGRPALAGKDRPGHAKGRRSPIPAGARRDGHGRLHPGDRRLRPCRRSRSQVPGRRLRVLSRQRPRCPHDRRGRRRRGRPSLPGSAAGRRLCLSCRPGLCPSRPSRRGPGGAAYGRRQPAAQHMGAAGQTMAGQARRHAVRCRHPGRHGRRRPTGAKGRL